MSAGARCVATLYDVATPEASRQCHYDALANGSMLCAMHQPGSGTCPRMPAALGPDGKLLEEAVFFTPRHVWIRHTITGQRKPIGMSEGVQCMHVHQRHASGRVKERCGNRIYCGGPFCPWHTLLNARVVVDVQSTGARFAIGAYALDLERGATADVFPANAVVCNLIYHLPGLVPQLMLEPMTTTQLLARYGSRDAAPYAFRPGDAIRHPPLLCIAGFGVDGVGADGAGADGVGADGAGVNGAGVNGAGAEANCVLQHAPVNDITCTTTRAIRNGDALRVHRGATRARDAGVWVVEHDPPLPDHLLHVDSLYKWSGSRPVHGAGHPDTPRAQYRYTADALAWLGGDDSTMGCLARVLKVMHFQPRWHLVQYWLRWICSFDLAAVNIGYDMQCSATGLLQIVHKGTFLPMLHALVGMVGEETDIVLLALMAAFRAPGDAAAVDKMSCADWLMTVSGQLDVLQRAVTRMRDPSAEWSQEMGFVAQGLLMALVVRPAWAGRLPVVQVAAAAHDHPCFVAMGRTTEQINLSRLLFAAVTESTPGLTTEMLAWHMDMLARASGPTARSFAADLPMAAMHREVFVRLMDAAGSVFRDAVRSHCPEQLSQGTCDGKPSEVCEHRGLWTWVRGMM